MRWTRMRWAARAAMLGALLGVSGCGSGSSAAQPPSGAHVLYLQFEGQALHPGADDARANASALVATTVTLPAYLAADAQRATRTQAISDEVEALLRPYDVLVTRARPASGSYDMVVLGGSSTQVGLTAGLQGIAPVDCTAGPTHVALVFDVATGHDAARQVVGALGLGHAIPPSSAPTDCLCAGATCTASLAGACSIGGPGTPVAPGAACTSATTMDEGALFRVAFGPHP